ncbi:MAG: hypothetical protein WBG92_08630, partial [Thiohalocapsa sp.]
ALATRRSVNMKRMLNKPTSRSKGRWRAMAVAVALLQAGCATPNLADFRTVEISAEPGSGAELVNGLPLRSGQVIIREAATSMGFLMNLMAEEYLPFGHAGIIVVEAEGTYVYDAFGLLNARFWEPPTKRIRGRIRRIPLTSFLARGTVSAIYDHHDADRQAVADFAIEAYRSRMAFDGLFDYRTPEQVYCSEFVAAALRAAGAEVRDPIPRTQNSSLRRVMAWLELDAPGFIVAGQLINSATEVARISPRYSSAQIDAHFAFERAMHNRFRDDQKLGNLYHWTSAGPRIRPHLADLRRRVLEGADAADDPRRWAAQQIDQALGPRPTRVVGR